MTKQRLDIALVERGYFDTRHKAQGNILAGNVFVNEKKIVKAGYKINKDDRIRIKETKQYVSRGGYKLEKAIKDFELDIGGKVCLDIGSSTGGFTDCLLQNGADIRSVQEMLGHESILTTEIYTHLDSSYLRDTITSFHPRSKKKG